MRRGSNRLFSCFILGLQVAFRSQSGTFVILSQTITATQESNLKHTEETKGNHRGGRGSSLHFTFLYSATATNLNEWRALTRGEDESSLRGLNRF